MSALLAVESLEARDVPSAVPGMFAVVDRTHLHPGAADSLWLDLGGPARGADAGARWKIDFTLDDYTAALADAAGHRITATKPG